MKEENNCELCGEPMTEEDGTMFRYHGYSRDCPKPPLPKIKNISVEDLREKIEEKLRELNSTLHKQCLDTGLITFEQWNEEIAPKLSALAMAISGNESGITARTYRLYKDA